MLQKSIIFYTFWIFTHYISAHMYTRYCTPWSLVGFFMSPFLTSSPQCKALQWFVFSGSNSIHAMWILIGSSVFKYLNSGASKLPK